MYDTNLDIMLEQLACLDEELSEKENLIDELGDAYKELWKDRDALVDAINRRRAYDAQC